MCNPESTTAPEWWPSSSSSSPCDLCERLAMAVLTAAPTVAAPTSIEPCDS